MEKEIWFTAILNKLFGGVVTTLLTTIGLPPADFAHPIPNYIAMEILVIVVILSMALWVRRSLSVETPGNFQQALEWVVEFNRNLTNEIIGQGGERYVAILGTLGLFIVLCNLLGLVPTLETPTAHIEVTLGCAVVVFLYYNYQGVSQQGVLGYLKTFCGPVWWLALIMLPVELISNLARLLSLSVRLYANMFAGGLLEQVFTGLVPILVPSLLMALHVFVSLIQTYIFMLLPAVYLNMAVSEEH